MFDTGLFIITQVVGFGEWLGVLTRVVDPELKNAVTDPTCQNNLDSVPTLKFSVSVHRFLYVFFFITITFLGMFLHVCIFFYPKFLKNADPNLSAKNYGFDQIWM